MKNLLFSGVFLMMIALPLCCFAEDGTYEATVTMDSGVYDVPVEVGGGCVTVVHLPDNVDMDVYKAMVNEEGNATGKNDKGETVKIEIEGYNWPISGDMESDTQRGQN